MIEFLRDPATGYVYAYRLGKLVGPVLAMGDVNVPPEPSKDLWREAHGNRDKLE